MASTAKEFLKSAKTGDVARLKALLDVDKALLGVRDTDGSTALHCATWKGHLETVAFLVEAGSDVRCHNSNEHWGTTPLHAAAHANHTAIAELLINAGADVNAKDMHGKTPLHHTSFHKANAVAKVLTKHGAK